MLHILIHPLEHASRQPRLRSRALTLPLDDLPASGIGLCRGIRH